MDGLPQVGGAHLEGPAHRSRPQRRGNVHSGQCTCAGEPRADHPAAPGVRGGAPADRSTGAGTAHGQGPGPERRTHGCGRLLRRRTRRAVAVAVVTRRRCATRTRAVVVRLRRRRPGLQRVIEGLLVRARRVERIAAAPVRQRQPGRLGHVVRRHLGPAVPRGQRHRRAGHHDVGPHAVDAVRQADAGYPVQLGIGQDHGGQQVARGHDLPGERRVLARPRRSERLRVGLVRQPPAHHLGPLGRLGRRGHRHHEAEPVHQLGARLALLRVHGADQDEPGRVPDRDAVALHVRPAHGGGVQQQVDQVVGQQVHLVDVQHAAVRGGEQSGLVGLHAVGEGALQVERADHAVLGGAHRQFDQRGRPRPGRRGRLVRAVRALRVGPRRIAGEPAARHDRDLRQEGSQCPYHRGFGGAFLPAHQDAADGGRHGGQQQGQPQVTQADDGGERVRRHARSLPRVSTPAGR